MSRAEVEEAVMVAIRLNWTRHSQVMKEKITGLQTWARREGEKGFGRKERKKEAERK